MVIEAGKRYVLGNGEITDPLQILYEGFIANTYLDGKCTACRTWTMEGEWLEGQESVLNIVKEYTEEKTMELEVGKTYRNILGKLVTITGTSSVMESFPFLGDNGRSYTSEGKYLENSTHEEDLAEEFTGFRTQQEIYGYLAGGGYVTFKEDLFLGFHEGTMTRLTIFGEVLFKDFSWSFNSPEDWSIAFPQTKPEPKWYDNIPEQGILCWVKDEEEDEAKLTTVIEYHRYEGKYNFKSPEDYWEHATPVTLDEIANFIYECE